MIPQILNFALLHLLLNKELVRSCDWIIIINYITFTSVRQRRPQPQTPHPSLQHHPVQNTPTHTPLNTPSRPPPQNTPSPPPQIITTPVPPTRGGDGNTNAQINPHSQTAPFIPPGITIYNIVLCKKKLDFHSRVLFGSRSWTT